MGVLDLRSPDRDARVVWAETPPNEPKRRSYQCAHGRHHPDTTTLPSANVACGQPPAGRAALVQPEPAVNKSGTVRPVMRSMVPPAEADANIDSHRRSMVECTLPSAALVLHGPSRLTPAALQPYVFVRRPAATTTTMPSTMATPPATGETNPFFTEPTSIGPTCVVWRSLTQLNPPSASTTIPAAIRTQPRMPSGRMVPP